MRLRSTLPWLLFAACGARQPAPPKAAPPPTPPPALETSAPTRPRPACETCRQRHAAHASGPGPSHPHAPHAAAEHAPLTPLVHRFERAEDWRARFEPEGRERWQKPAEVIALLEVRPGMTVADIGAGTGYFMSHLDAAVGVQGKVLALDIEASMVRYLEARAAREGLHRVEARQVTVDSPQLAPSSVSRALIVNTWHHIPERERYAAQLREALAPGGFVLIVDYTKEAERGPPPEHRLSAEQVALELEAGGLEAEVVREDLPQQYVVRGRRLP